MSTNQEIALIALGFLAFLTGVITIRRVYVSVHEKLGSLWRLEAKVDLLLKAAEIEFDPYQNLPPEVAKAMARGERIQAIKLYRDASGAGLKEAVDFINEAERRAKREAR